MKEDETGNAKMIYKTNKDDKNQSEYVGKFKADKKEDTKGKFTWPDDTVYVGKFENDEING